jgi:hypothetical protein
MTLAGLETVEEFNAIVNYISSVLDLGKSFLVYGDFK